MPEPVFMKLGTYVMVPDPTSTAYFISLCVYVCIPFSWLGNGSARTIRVVSRKGSDYFFPQFIALKEVKP
jgi:hypothetical protein